MGIPTPKKENVTKTWSDEDLDSALEALRRKEMSANKASKQFGVPSSVSDECLLVVFMAIFLSVDLIQNG